MEEIDRIEPVLLNLAIYLVALVVAVVAFRRLGLGSALGYLVVGSLVGPAVLGLVGQNETVRTLADFGVVLLLFVVGLELRPVRLWRMRVDIFGVGTAQLLITTVILGTALRWVFDWDLVAAFVAASALALSSTAFGAQLLTERRAIGTPFGDRAISILLFQDLALVPLVALIALVGTDGTAAGATHASTQDIAVAVLALATLILVGYFAINPFFRLIAIARADEAFTAAALLVALAAALLAAFAGFSMAMGAILAGILLAGSEYRHRIESAVEPFRGLLLGMFFMGIGVDLDWLAVLNSLHIAIAGAIGVFVLKGLVLFALARIRGCSMIESVRMGLLLGQTGEFGFLLFTVAASHGVFGTETASVLTAIAVISMAITPVAMRMLDHWHAKSGQRVDTDLHLHHAPDAPILIVGFGRFGQIVADILSRRGFEMLLVEQNPELIRIARERGYEAYFGKLGGSEFMQTIAKRGLTAIVVCIDDTASATRVIGQLREMYPDAVLIARARDRFARWEMMQIGADNAVPEVFESALSMGREALTLLGEGECADEIIAEMRRTDEENFNRLQARYARSDAAPGSDEDLDIDLDDEEREESETAREPFVVRTARRSPKSLAWMTRGPRRWIRSLRNKRE